MFQFSDNCLGNGQCGMNGQCLYDNNGQDFCTCFEGYEGSKCEQSTGKITHNWLFILICKNLYVSIFTTNSL